MVASSVDLAHFGIVLKCLCGAAIIADVAHVLFADGGRIKISCRELRCFVCGAIFRPGEWLRYEIDYGQIRAKDRRDHLMDDRSSYER